MTSIIQDQIEERIQEVFNHFKSIETKAEYILLQYPDTWNNEIKFQIRYLRTFHPNAQISKLPNLWTIHRARYSVIRKLKLAGIDLSNKDLDGYKAIKAEGIRRAILDKDIG